MRFETATCATHGPFRAVVAETKSRGQVMGACPQCQAEEDRRRLDEVHQAQAAAKKRAGQKTLVQILGHSGIPERFMRRGFDTFEVHHDGHRQAVDAARAYAEQFADHRKQGRGLLFIGPTGTGKSHLAIAIAKAVIRNGGTAVYATALDVFQIVKETFSGGSEMSERQAVAQFVTPDLLVIDEVGVQYETAAERVIMTNLIDKRYQSLRPTILLSNHSLPEIERVLGPRVGSRLAEVNEVVRCTWDDWRKSA